jgi:hypothetical protein
VRVLNGLLIATFALTGVAAIALPRWGKEAEPVEAGLPAELEVLAPVAAQPAPAAVVVPAASAGHVNYGISLAIFTDDRLDQCVGSYVTPKPGSEDAAKESVEKRAQETADKVKAWKGADKPLLLSKTCLEQFPDRQVLATCANQTEAKLGRVMAETYYYDARTLDKSDAEMKSCISGGGDWRPNPDQSIVERARIAEKQRKLEKMLADAEKTAATYEP